VKKCNFLSLFLGCTLVVVLTLSLVSCLDLVGKRPTFILKGITVSPRAWGEMNIVLSFDVENPNPFALTLKSFDYTLTLNQDKVGSGRLERELTIPASSTVALSAPILAKFDNLGKMMKIFITGSDLFYKIEGKAEVSAFLGTVSLPFSKEGQVNLNRAMGGKK